MDPLGILFKRTPIDLFIYLFILKTVGYIMQVLLDILKCNDTN